MTKKQKKYLTHSYRSSSSGISSSIAVIAVVEVEVEGKAAVTNF